MLMKHPAGAMDIKIANALTSIRSENCRQKLSLSAPHIPVLRMRAITKQLTHQLHSIRSSYSGIDLLFAFASAADDMAARTALRDRDPSDYNEVCFNVIDLCLPLPGESAEWLFQEESDLLLGDHMSLRAYTELRAKHCTD